MVPQRSRVTRFQLGVRVANEVSSSFFSNYVSSSSVLTALIRLLQSRWDLTEYRADLTASMIDERTHAVLEGGRRVAQTRRPSRRRTTCYEPITRPANSDLVTATTLGRGGVVPSGKVLDGFSKVLPSPGC